MQREEFIGMQCDWEWIRYEYRVCMVKCAAVTDVINSNSIKVMDPLI